MKSIETDLNYFNQQNYSQIRVQNLIYTLIKLIKNKEEKEYLKRIYSDFDSILFSVM